MSHSSAKPFEPQNPAAPVFRPFGDANISRPRERRRRPRVLLELPVRIRWLGPFGLETEITQTRNVSREGLLISAVGPRQAGSLLWATFPYDAAVAFTESETPGRVVRCAANTIAIAFHNADLLSNGGAFAPVDRSSHTGRNDRRRHIRIPLSFLVRVMRSNRISQNPLAPPEAPILHEETMTVDVSPYGMIFCTLRIYEVGDTLMIAARLGRKLSCVDRHARVVRVARPHSDSPLSHVAVEFLS